MSIVRVLLCALAALGALHAQQIFVFPAQENGPTQLFSGDPASPLATSGHISCDCIVGPGGDGRNRRGRRASRKRAKTRLATTPSA